MYPKTLAEVPASIRPRVTVERRIVKRTVDALLAAGFALQTDQGSGGEELVPETPTRDRSAILAQLCETDDERLYVTMADERQNALDTYGWVYFVFGNDGPDVICDYTTNLDTILQPVLDYANTLDDLQ